MSKARIKKWMWLALAGIVALQVYFVRELLAAELLFGMLLVFGLSVAFLFFLIQQIGERGLGWLKPYALELARSTWRRVVQLEVITRKTLRHQRSESAH
jgi:hypothetical protein